MTGFYLHLDPAQSFLGMGLWHPDTDTRALVRDAIVKNTAGWKRATTSKSFITQCRVSGDLMKRPPPGYDPNHPVAADLMRKDFTCGAEFSEKQVCSPEFLDDVTGKCRAAAPFMEFLTRAVGLPWAAGEQPRIRELLSVEREKL